MAFLGCMVLSRFNIVSNPMSRASKLRVASAVCSDFMQPSRQQVEGAAPTSRTVGEIAARAARAKARAEANQSAIRNPRKKPQAAASAFLPLERPMTKSAEKPKPATRATSAGRWIDGRAAKGQWRPRIEATQIGKATAPSGSQCKRPLAKGPPKFNKSCWKW